MDLPLLAALRWAACGLIVALAWTDLRERRLPGPLVLSLAATGLGAAWLASGPPGLAWAGVSALLSALPFWALALARRRPAARWRSGGGDLRYALALGGLLGAPMALLVLAAGAAMGGGLGLLLRDAGGRPVRRIPYATCCAAAMGLGLVVLAMRGDGPGFATLRTPA